MKRTKTLGITLIGLAVGLLSGCASSAQYGQSRSPYPPSQDQRQRDYDQPGYDQYGYDEPYDGDFYDDLRPHGQWVRTPEYGMVWIPNVEAGFQPYATNGRWVVTQFGNTWVSDYNWGWAPFHYGRWYQDRFRGWAWVPGRDWGPAWVSWRSGGGYYGWAPLGPGMNINVNVNIAPDYWMFVPQNYISSPRLSSYCVSRRQVVNVYQNTTIINNVYRVNNRSYAYGPRRDELERVTRQRVPVYRIDNTNRPGRDEVRDNSVSIYRPERSRGPRGSYEQPSSGNYNDRQGNYGRPNENTGSGRSSESRGGYSQPDNRGGYQRPNDGGNSGRPTEPGTYQRPNSRGNGTYSGSESRPAPAPYEGNGPRGRYNDNTQRAPQSGPQPTPQVQPEQRMESLPQPGYGGRRGSGGGGGYSQPQPQREPSQSNGNGPGYSQPNNRGSREAQPQPQPQSQPQPQEQRPGNYERRAQEADRNLGQPPAQSQPGNGGRSRGPR